MTARLLTILALALPLAACAAQPGPGQAAGRPADAAPAAVTTVPHDTHAQAAAQPVAEAPAAAQADTTRQDARAGASTQRDDAASAAHRTEAGGNKAGKVVTAAATSGTARAAAPAAAGTGTSATGTSTTGTSATGTSASDTSTTGTSASDTSGSGMSAPATPAAPDVASPRPAPGATVPPVTMPAGSSTGSLLQTLFALILVLAVLGALAWFLKRYGPKVGGGNANVRLVGSLNLGGRERIVVVEVGNQWIVVGASPGRINALATMPREDGLPAGEPGGAHAALAPHAPAAHSFADWLKQTIDKRK
jgi:flagellar biosynthetic protein FliO